MMIKYISNQSAFKYTSLLNAWLNEKSFEIWGSVALLPGFPGKEAHLEQQKIVQNQKFWYF